MVGAPHVEVKLDKQEEAPGQEEDARRHMGAKLAAVGDRMLRSVHADPVAVGDQQGDVAEGQILWEVLPDGLIQVGGCVDH